jgi:superfamily II DNA or RNA helicase
MKSGFYEKVLTKSTKKEIEDLGELALYMPQTFGKEDGAIYLHRFFSQILMQAFQRINEAKEESAKPKLIELANKLVEQLSAFLEDQSIKDEKIQEEGQIVKALFNRQEVNFADLQTYIKEVFPFTGLSESELFTGSKVGIAMESELRKEMKSCDEVCWLVSFLKFEGVRLFEETFKILEQNQIPVKIICTVYMGATDLKAIDFLSSFKNIQIRISYNSRHERLHAKAYLFRRHSGFDTGYVGSSNLSKSALTHGLEWNLKITRQEIPHVLDKCIKTFETYWNDKEFELYNPETDRDKLKEALSNGSGNHQGEADRYLSFFEINPYPFQKEILEKLEKARLEGQSRNLLVAATGTGKTVMAAFDFLSFLKKNPQAKFLFVAHREEILKQSRATFRQILRDAAFGELWYSREQPKSFHQLFVSVQTLKNQLTKLNLGSNYFDYIIIDEVHHAAASSYQFIFEQLTPKLLLGLTATPERHDGEDITRYFGNEISAEIRLPEAMARGLLCPFQYFAISDETDISHVSWRKGRYEISGLEKVYTEDDRRAKDILKNCEKYLKNLEDVKAVGFCVSVKHAKFMHDKFEGFGLKSAYLTADVGVERSAIIRKFKRGEINYLFVVDIFNEGVDIPEIDTILFLRPTESLTIFLQQLGRGLRLSQGKNYLTVLDFVGQVRAEYSFEHRFRAMLGKTHTRVRDEIEQDFPHLPLGCSIVLEKVAKEIILINLSNQNRGGLISMLIQIKSFISDYDVEPTLANFLELTDNNLHTIYSTEYLWFELVAKAKGTEIERNENHKILAKCLKNSMFSCESNSYFEFIIKLIELDFRLPSNEFEEQFLLMLYVDIFSKHDGLHSYFDLIVNLKEFFRESRVKIEFVEYLKFKISKIESIEKEIILPFPCVLKLNGRYTRNQILYGTGANNLSLFRRSQEGVFRPAGKNFELFFVTLNKESNGFHSSISYEDYFINSELFHWQSQNSASPESNAGKAYIDQSKNNKNFLLFVRERSEDENKVTMAFKFLGPLTFLKHEGSKPMSITWRLRYEPPAGLLNEGLKLAV